MNKKHFVMVPLDMSGAPMVDDISSIKITPAQFVGRADNWGILTGSINDLIAVRSIKEIEIVLRDFDFTNCPAIYSEDSTPDNVRNFMSDGYFLFSSPCWGTIDNIAIRESECILSDGQFIVAHNNCRNDIRYFIDGDIEDRYSMPLAIYFSAMYIVQSEIAPRINIILKRYVDSGIDILETCSGVSIRSSGKCRLLTNFSARVTDWHQRRGVWFLEIKNSDCIANIEVYHSDLMSLKILKEKLLRKGKFFLYSTKIEEVQMLFDSFPRKVDVK